MATRQYPIILDTDIGTDVDDVVALGTILRTPSLDLRAVTTVYVDTVLRARMVQAVLAVAGRSEVPVGAGVGAPLMGRDKLVWGGWEGAGVIDPSGDVTEPAAAVRAGAGEFRHGVDLMIEQVMAHQGEITIVAIGPLTNLAAAITREPRFVAAARGFVIMGGLIQRRMDQLTMPYVEHNIRCDPEAARIVFQSGAHTTLVPLDVTTKTRIWRADLTRVSGSDPLGALIADQLDRYFGVNKRDSTTPHDALAVAALAHPEFVRTRPMYVRVETQGEYTRAETVATLADEVSPFGAPDTGNLAPIDVALEVDAPAFERWLIETLSTPIARA